MAGALNSAARGYVSVAPTLPWVGKSDRADVPGRGRVLRNPAARILVLTALGTVDERVAGLNAGADDYLVKPFSFAELLARLAAIARRSLQNSSQHLTVGPLTLEPATRRVIRGDREVELTPAEFTLLKFLIRHAGQVVTWKMRKS